MDERQNVTPEVKTPEAAESKKGNKKKDVKTEIIEWIKALAAAVVIVVLLQSFLFRIIRVDGQSMETTLHNGERLFVNVAEVRFSSVVPRNSIVICHYPNRQSSILGVIKYNTSFVKRVVAVPGDKVYRENGVTHVVYTDDSGESVDVALDERYATYYAFGSPDDYEAYELGEDEYFVVGDNRYNSHDSRDWNDSDASRDVGPITKDMIVGRVREVIWPLNSIRAAE